METRPFSDLSYHEFLNEERLMGSRCHECGALFVPPRPICIRCQGQAMEWVEMTGEGKLAAFTCVAVGPRLMIEQGYDREHPYVSGVVELAEGARVDAQIVEVDASRPETIQIRMPLVVKFLHRGAGKDLRTTLGFRPI
jgi:uncharacterized OB-fold protein